MPVSSGWDFSLDRSQKRQLWVGWVPSPTGRGRAEEELEWWGRITRQPFTLVTVMFRYEWPGWTCCSEEWLVLWQVDVSMCLSRCSTPRHSDTMIDYLKYWQSPSFVLAGLRDQVAPRAECSPHGSRVNVYSRRRLRLMRYCCTCDVWLARDVWHLIDSGIIFVTNCFCVCGSSCHCCLFSLSSIKLIFDDSKLWSGSN